MPDFKDIEGPVARLNRLSPDEAYAELLKCCGSTRWAREVAALKPFWDVTQAVIIGHRVWTELREEDWLEAFRAHPKIGETKAKAAVTEQERRWSEGEQARARDASDETRDALAEANREYEERFGFIFIICASGRTAEEILAALRARARNDRDAELRAAAAEQWNITELRLRKFLDAA
ncbi:MAG TPA: 2-oxo-4-hydroxy-4-carboxy-5-ureidoimidazoline decarboxylase [Pyrinomonadaceae bacterium]|nr:2-oxo-4-hydroxy-4-carboxy-5-ureidoimidazoline decarboxylase [Pyrinomonadaceae bacterium]